MKRFFTSKISGKKYHSRFDLEFKKELHDSGMTMNDYCEKFMVNVAHKKHLRELKEGEHFLYDKIYMMKNTYMKIIVNDQYYCEICKDFYAASKPSFISHIKRYHKLSLYDYFKETGYKEINPKYELCAFCNKRESRYDIKWNAKDRTFEKIYYDGYFCESEECKDLICKEFFGKAYKDSKKEFEHIGGKTEFLCKLHKTDKKGLIKLGKSKIAKHKSTWKSNLHGFIEKYGVEKGIEKYKERSQKIGKAQYIDWYIKKYGEIEGPKRYFDKMNKISSFHKNNTNITSKGELELYNLLKMIYDNAKLEYPTPNGIVDIFIPEKNIVIEYYGDYWHCNPKYYAKDFYNKNLMMTASEKHLFDKNKNEKYLKSIASKIIIIWESSYKCLDKSVILNQMKNFIDTDLTKGKILWI